MPFLDSFLLKTLPADWSWLASPISTLVSIGVVFGMVMTGVAYGILVERWVAAAIQNRLGPNRVGPWGLFQPIADGLKPLLKEEVIPARAEKVLFLMAPALAAMTTLGAFAVVPFGPADDSNGPIRFIAAPAVDIGILYIFALGSLAVYGVILAGWSSNNKYSFLGALRSSAQVVSYEIPLGLSVLGVVLVSSSLNLEDIQRHQTGNFILGWNVVTQPLAFLLFLTAALAEAHRLPFDLSECEQELVGGYHTEYSGLKFAFFMLSEYVHMIAVAFLASILFLGGWHFPLIAESTSAYPLAWLVKFGVLLAKVGSFVLLFMFLRWTIPRFRFDQLMGLAWRVMIPLAIANFLVVLVVKQFKLHSGWMTAASVFLFVGVGLWHAATVQRRISTRRFVPAAAMGAGA
jgi:NADH-quinone oxidoreductase subunit H